MGDTRFESNAKEVMNQFKQMTKLTEREGVAFVNDSLNKVWETIVPITPIKSGDLRRGYRVMNARKLSTGRIVGVLINNEKYFKYVNDGHRTRNGGFVKGRFMLQRATNLANMTYIPRRWKSMAIKVLKGAKK
ncbi:HK97 gp10 family phage protein [Enterococcus massiliensis]|uniref:HK97 gp10 family phage protein n=1 Tax=Enterococcus massiliensis TaxID=1640685 RepID=UPI00065E2E1A|nr:HK97 gp10 family phage protein [Enterococcus massiliensis]